MASSTLTTPSRRRLSNFAKGLAKPLTDSRRRNFIHDMVTGLVVAGHVHLTAVARGICRGAGNVHAVEKRLSRNLAGEHWGAGPIAEELLQRSAAMAARIRHPISTTFPQVTEGSERDGSLAKGELGVGQMLSFADLAQLERRPCDLRTGFFGILLIHHIPENHRAIRSMTYRSEKKCWCSPVG